MTVVRTLLLMLCAPAAAGCAGPEAPPPPQPGWRASMAFVTPQASPSPAPPAAPAPATLSAASPAPAPSPGESPAPVRLCFQSDRRPGQGGWDLYLYDVDQDTVLALPGVNTPDDETNPSCDEKWILFQRGAAGDPDAQQDLFLYDRQAKLVLTLRRVNTAANNERDASISNDGRWIAYVSDEDGTPGVRLYDVQSGDIFLVPGANRPDLAAGSPSISGDAKRIAYEARPLGGRGNSDIVVYDLEACTQFSPPFVNTTADETTPSFSADGRHLLFVSNRFGTDDLFEADLETGFLDNLADLNTDQDEENPTYPDEGIGRILFQTQPAGDLRRADIRLYDRRSHLLDTLPVANDPLAGSALGN